MSRNPFVRSRGEALLAVILGACAFAGCSEPKSPPPPTPPAGPPASIRTSPASGNTSEAGAQASFTVVLESEPSADVTVHFASSDLSEGTVGAGSLTFTAANWNAPQTVLVTGVDDEEADGDQSFAITFSSTTSGDAAYAALIPADVAFTNTDDDSAGIAVGEPSGSTTEAGAQANFTVVLHSQPSADVTVNFASNDLTEGTPSAQALTFTALNWKAPQTVTVTGVDDDEVDGPATYLIEFTATTSEDAAYAAIVPTSVELTNTDDDTAGFTVSDVSGPTTEAGGQATFSVVLNSKPSADVVVSFASTDTTEGTVSGSPLTFTALNWNAPQTVLLTGLDDDFADGNQPWAVTFSATVSDDAAYAALVPGDVALTNTDDETAGFTLSPVSGPTTEAGGEASFTVVLNSQPYSDVTVHFASSDTSEGTVSPTSLSFTDVNWKAPQTVTVTGVDDDVADGNQPFAVTFSATTSADTAYAALTPANVDFTNTDDDSAGITLSAVSGPTTEAGGEATFTVVLTSEPTADVTVNFASTDTTEGTVSGSSLTFTAADWSTEQTVTLSGVDDAVADGNQPWAVTFSATTSADSAYAAITPANVDLTNTDDDTAGITVSAISGPTTEAGGEATFTVVLTSEPTADVTVNFASNDTSEGTVSPASLTFTTADWSTPQTATATGVDDTLEDGDQPWAVTFSATTSADPAYAAIQPGNVEVTNKDDDSHLFTFADTTGDDVSSAALIDFFSGLTLTASDFIFFEVNTGPAPGAWCAENAKWYADQYLANAVNGGTGTSGAWNKYVRPGDATQPWNGPTTQGFSNYYGSGCSGYAYDWCSEWGISAAGSQSLSLGITPGRTNSEAYAGGWDSSGQTVTIRIASTRQSACGF